jgi:carbon starvation protein
MLLESLVAIMALIAACTLDPGVYLSMNVKGAGATPEAVAADTVAKVTAAGFPVSVDQMNGLADQVKENTLFGRTGGAATLAVGMASIFAKVTRGYGLDLWYHFAIMFEALFILTTLDAGTRVGRYLLQDFLGNIWKPLADTSNMQANVLASTLVVLGWGYFLIQGVRDPLGGINSLWPLFGIANQLLAAIALCLATTVILKMQLKRRAAGEFASGKPNPAVALVTLIPLAWLLIVTITAGVQKIGSPDTRIGFLSNAKKLEASLPTLEQALTAARATGGTTAIEAAEKALRNTRVIIFNQYLDAFVAGAFLVMVVAIVAICVWEWFRLLTGRRAPDLHESPAVWLPDYAVVEGGPLRTVGAVALVCAMAKELSGEAEVDRIAKQESVICCEEHRLSREQIYIQATDARYKSIRRCC